MIGGGGEIRRAIGGKGKVPKDALASPLHNKTSLAKFLSEFPIYISQGWISQNGGSRNGRKINSCSLVIASPKHMNHVGGPTCGDLIVRLRATSHTRLKAHDHGNVKALVGRKGGDSSSSLHTRR
jgi:hypothetical protein